jgi:putative two-component system response regulator
MSLSHLRGGGGVRTKRTRGFAGAERLRPSPSNKRGCLVAESVACEEHVSEMAVVRSLLAVGTSFHACHDRRQVLDTILSQARILTRAQAGSLYLVWHDRLKFVAAQNDQLGAENVARHLLDKELPISAASLVGYVALNGTVMNIPDTHAIPESAPYRINRDLDAKTGYRVRSILAIPLSCPDGERVGVLELFDRVEADGSHVPFPDSADDAVMALASTAAIALHNVGLQERLRQVHLNTIFRLSTVAEYRDADTGEHIQRVSATSQLIATALGLDAGQVELLKYASPMHDVGKVAIPDAILLKPGHLTPQQRKLMERHTTVGAEILDRPEDAVLAMARDVALCHHERWDGNGYPHKLKGKDIPLCGRIVGLADVFDAVVSQRCYKAAVSLDVALDIVHKDTGSHFDPEIVEAFLGVLDKVAESYPAMQAK